MNGHPEWVLATGNAGKLAEFQQRLAGLGVRIRPQSDFHIGEVEETGVTFVENALIKARHAARESGLPALADDSGLRVRALGGDPGVRSARYAGEPSDAARNNAALLQAMDGESDRRCAFHCVLVWLRHAQDPAPVIAQAAWAGSLLSAPRGTGGFGYDPLFEVEGRGLSAAELPAAEKNRISHRGQAIDRLLAELQALE